MELSERALGSSESRRRLGGSRQAERRRPPRGRGREKGGEGGAEWGRLG